MNQRNLDLLIQKSESAMIRMVVWFIAANVGLFWLILTIANPPGQVLGFAVPALLFGVGLFVAVLYAFKYARLNELMHNMQPPPPPRFETLETTTKPRALETRPRENLLLLTKYKFTPSEWRQLVKELRIIKPRWTRDALIRSGLFDNITAPGMFNEVCAEFERVGVIAGKNYKWRITQEGWADLCKAAGLRVVI